MERVDGDKINYQSDVAPLVQQGDYFDVTVKFEAPLKTGPYFTVLQLRNKDGKFGEKVACDFIVEDDRSESFKLIQMMKSKKQARIQ